MTFGVDKPEVTFSATRKGTSKVELLISIVVVGPDAREGMNWSKGKKLLKNEEHFLPDS